jgi:uroporphyrinogen-III synthase
MRILVFRPQADAERSARAIAARGNEPVLAPLFEVVPSNEPAPAGPFSALVLTSGNAVPALADAPADWRDVPVFTVGARTAARVREAGYGDARSADGDRHDLIALIGANLPARAKLLLIVGRDRHEDVPQKLTDAGYEVMLWTAYAAEALPELPERAVEALKGEAADAALHYSARGAATFIALARRAGLAEEALGLTHVALSADVAAPLIAAGASTVLVAEYPEEAAMLAALDEVSARIPPDASEPALTPQPDAEDAGGAGGKRRARASARRTPPTIEGAAVATTLDSPGSMARSEAAAEAVLPTEALPQEFSPPDPAAAPDSTEAKAETQPSATMAQISRPEAADARSRTPWPALALAGLVGGVIGAGLVMLALSRATPPITPEQIAELRSRLDALQGAATALDGKATSAAAAAAKAGADAQATAGRIAELASAQRAQAPDAGAIADLGTQVERAQATAAAIGQRLDQTTARIGSVETLAKTAATPSVQALAAARIVLAERVQAAIASGQPFAGDVAALAKGGGAAEQLAALNAVAASGAPTRETLLAQFRSHRTMFTRELTPSTAGWQDRLLGLASRIVTIRPIGDTGANDPGTMLIRFENAIVNGDIVAAAALWGQLPEPARRASAEFGANLQKRAAADAAIAKIAQDAVAALGAAG